MEGYMILFFNDTTWLALIIAISPNVTILLIVILLLNTAAEKPTKEIKYIWRQRSNKRRALFSLESSYKK